MQFFLISFLIMLLAVLAMAVGVLCGGRSIKGSCGGLNNIKGLEGEGKCGICGREASAVPCDSATQQVANSTANSPANSTSHSTGTS